MAESDAPTDTRKGAEGGLWNRMRESYGEPSELCDTDGAFMIRAVAGWINQWAGSNQIDTDRLMQALEAEAQAAQAGIDAVKGG